MHYLPSPESVPRSIQFRWIFPLGQVLLCMFLLAAIHAVPGYFAWRMRSVVAQGIALLNMPGTFVQIPEAILRPDHNFWAPPGMDSRTWAAISASTIGMLFWWMAGRAIDALIALKRRQFNPRINWFETIVGFLLMLAGAAMFSAGVIYGFFAEHDSTSVHLGAAGGLWALLGSLSVIARFRQWRLRKRTAASQSISVSVSP